jgi:hypothetical protein
MAYFTACPKCNKPAVVPDHKIDGSPEFMAAANRHVDRSVQYPGVCACPRDINNELISKKE